MTLREAIKRAAAAEELVKHQERQWRRIVEARKAAETAGVWTEAVQHEFDREAQRAFKRLSALRKRLNRFLAVEVDEKALEDAWEGR